MASDVCTLVYCNCLYSALRHRQACFVQPLECQRGIALSKASRCKYRGLNKLFIFELHRYSLKTLKDDGNVGQADKTGGRVTEYRIVKYRIVNIELLSPEQKRESSKNLASILSCTCFYEQTVSFMALISTSINLHVNITYFKFWCQCVWFLFSFSEYRNVLRILK